MANVKFLTLDYVVPHVISAYLFIPYNIIKRRQTANPATNEQLRYAIFDRNFCRKRAEIRPFRTNSRGNNTVMQLDKRFAIFANDAGYHNHDRFARKKIARKLRNAILVRERRYVLSGTLNHNQR